MSRDISLGNVRLEVVEVDWVAAVMDTAVEDVTSATSVTDLATSLVTARKIRTVATVAMV